MATQIFNNRNKSRYELPIEGDEVAVSYCSPEDGRVVLRHTEVPNEYGGQGLGKKLAEAFFEQLKAEGKRVIAKCRFMAAFAAKRPQYVAILDG